jgi:hypothetical protein
MASGGLHCADFLFVDPLLQRGIADPENLCGFARREEFGWGHGDVQFTRAEIMRLPPDAKLRRRGVSMAAR